MHPTIQFEIAKTRVADMQHEAERDRTVRIARTPRVPRAPRAARRQSVPGTLAQRLLRLS
jgi:hypothetical protein